MQSKLTLRMEETLIRKAKRLAQERGTSVSRIVSEYISKQPDGQEEDYPPITKSMVGVIKREGKKTDEDTYKRYLEEKYL